MKSEMVRVFVSSFCLFFMVFGMIALSLFAPKKKEIEVRTEYVLERLPGSSVVVEDKIKVRDVFIVVFASSVPSSSSAGKKLIDPGAARVRGSASVQKKVCVNRNLGYNVSGGNNIDVGVGSRLGVGRKVGVRMDFGGSVGSVEICGNGGDK